jgi:hypothetical protein
LVVLPANVHSLLVITWAEFAKAEPELAGFGAGRLKVPPAYLATVRHSGKPRVHRVMRPSLSAEPGLSRREGSPITIRVTLEVRLEDLARELGDEPGGTSSL